MSAQSSLQARLESSASDAQRRGLEAAVAAATRLATPIHLVGGSIRDLLLLGELLDIDLDLAVEGDALAVAAEVAHSLEGELRTHPRFLTAEVHFQDSHLDFVTTRQERYAGPASLPEVEPSDLQADLARRDFTINAMALTLWPESAAGLVDPFAGREDVELRLLRILHDRSFLDDPTRILRGVRLGARLDLEFEPHTAGLAQEAILADAFGPLSGDRLRHELVLLLEEEPVEKSLRWLERLGFFGVLGRSDPIGPREWQRISQVVARRAQGLGSEDDGPGVRWWLTILMALFLDGEAESRATVAERLSLDQELAEILVGASDRLQRTLDALGPEEVGGQALHQLLSNVPGEDLPLLEVLASPTAQRQLDRWRHELRPLHLSIGGKDLIAAGFPAGPALGPALQATLAARLDGVIDAEQELEFAVRILQGADGEES